MTPTRDRLTAANAALEAKVARLTAALQFILSTDGFSFVAAHRIARAALTETAPDGGEQ